MQVIIFTDNKNTATFFTRVEKSKSYDVSYQPLSGLKKNLNIQGEDSILYADLSALAPAAVKKHLAVLSSLKVVFGVIDSKGSFEDPVTLVYAGASDYIGKAQCKAGVDPSRIKRAFDFGRMFQQATGIPAPAKDEPAKTAKAKGSGTTAAKTAKATPAKTVAAKKKDFPSPISGRDWKSIQSGKSYTFCFMYIELDNQKYLKRRFAGPNLEKYAAAYHNFIARAVADLQGKIWMWTDLGGLILFPFDGENCPAIQKGIEMMLDRAISSYEQFDYDILFSFRLAVHIGDTVYRAKGDTGKIVSDSINSIHHLKQNFAQPGHMYLSGDVVPYIPEGLRDYFVSDGTYEGREIFRLKSFNAEPPVLE